MRTRAVVCSLLPLAALGPAWLLRQERAADPSLQVSPFRTSGIYRQGEMAGWTVVAGSAKKAHYSLRKNNGTELLSGELDLSTEPKQIQVALNEPAMLYLEIRPDGGKPLAYGAAVEPTRIEPVGRRPSDFDRFWERKLRELRAVPPEPRLTPADSGHPEVDYATLQMRQPDGTRATGQLAKPKRRGRFPAMLILQWASPPYPLHRSWVVQRASEGWLVLNVQPHDVLPTEPQGYYDALPTELKNYTTIHQEDRERNYFVSMYLRGVRGADFLASHPDWDGRTLVVTGTSMGGQQSFAVAGLHPKVTHMVVHVPAGCDLNGPIGGRQNGYPFYPWTNRKAMDVARYIDGAHFAPRIKAKCLVSMGFLDTVTPPAGIWAAFNRIAGPKEVAPLVDAPHNHQATAEQQRPYTARANEWFSTLSRGQDISPRPFRYDH